MKATLALLGAMLAFTTLEGRSRKGGLIMSKVSRLVFLVVMTMGAAFLGPLHSQLKGAQKPTAPRYPDAAYGGESVTLENSGMRLAVYKRLTGWGWVEISNAAGDLIAVLDHFGEVDPVVSGGVPVRIEAQHYQLDKGDFGQRLTFPVRLIWYQTARLHPVPALSKPALQGTVSITLAPEAPVAKLVYDLKPLTTLGVRYFRGPWLKVGSGSFGIAKTDGIFPGVDWMVGDEWSSGTDWIAHPYALRMVPHPFKVTAPVMTLSWKGTAISLAWDPLEEVMPGKRYLQPVYASPNFLDRANNQLMGLMLPSVAWGLEENTPPIHSTKPGPAPMELSPANPIHLEAEVFLTKGNSLDALVAWVKRQGLPEPPPPRYPFAEAMDRIARLYNTALWHEGRGWGTTAETANAFPPLFLERWVREGRDRETAKGLAEKLAWGRKQIESGQLKLGALPDSNAMYFNGTGAGRAGRQAMALWPKEAQLAHGRELVSYQREDGSFGFDPEGRHKNLGYGTQLERGYYGFRQEDYFLFSASAFRPLGTEGDTALDLSVEPAIDLFLLADSTGEEQFRTAGRKALDYCLTMERPEGGDWEECPLHGASLWAAGHAAIAYYLGYKAFHDPRYLEGAIHWIRSILVFTHLWQPAEVSEIYNTKPVLTSSSYQNSWADADVHAEVLDAFATSSELGIDWGKIDPEIDWDRFQKGITVAALRWMADHNDVTQKVDYTQLVPVRLVDQVKRGLLDMCYYDGYDVVTGIYGGGPWEPDWIAINLAAVLERERRQ